MKTNLENAWRLHFELNLDNFFSVEITDYRVQLLAWNTDQLEKFLFDKGYQVQWNDEMKNYRFETENLIIVLTEPSIV